jgi:hypothetical protein
MATDPSSPERREEPAGTGILLAVAAAIAAALGGWSSVLADRGSDTWHEAVREHVKQAAGAVEDIRFVYDEEAPTALQVAEARILSDEYRKAAGKASGLAREIVLIEGDAQEEAAGVLEAGSEMATDPRYDDPQTDGFDVGLRLAHVRQENPGLLTLRPGATQDEGSRLSAKASLLLLATVPVALAFVCGALVYGFPRWGRALVVAGFAFVAVGVVAAVAIGVVV